MSIATTAQYQFGYLAETTWGTTPAAALTKLRITGENLIASTQTAKSQEILGNREVQDIIRTGRGSQGSFNFELSYGNLDALLEGVFMATWATNVLEVGSTFKSYTMEKQFLDVGRYHTYTGQVINGMSLSIRPGSIITGSMEVLGKAPTVGSSSAGTGAIVAAPTNPVMNAVDYIQTLEEGGSPIGNVMGIDLNIRNNMRQQMALGDVDPIGMGLGQFEVEGGMELYFEDDTVYSKYLAFTTSSLQFVLGGASSLNYDFLISKLKYIGTEVVATGPNSDIMARTSFNAFIDASNTTLQLTRTP